MKTQNRFPTLSTTAVLLCAVVGPLGLSLTGCAHKSPEEKQIDQRITSEPGLKNKAALDLRNDRAIESATGLSVEERQKLTELRDSHRARLHALNEESLKIRSLLVQDVINPKSNPSEITALKKRLKDTENKRVSIYLDGIDRANSLLGRRTYPIEQRERIMRDIMEPRAPRVD